ncbi:MAG: extracellular solute-binding protein [Bacteroidetes bacterium]|nr:extracellular solute-binding protein [Bacteroidota bacterium]
MFINQMRNKYKVPVFVILLSVFFVSCKRNNDNKELLFWSSNNAQEITFSKMLVEKWNKEYPDKPVHVQPIPEGQSSEEIILAAVVGKTTPDIYANMWQGSVEMYAKAGVLVPFDTLDGFMEFIKTRCSDEVISEITSSDGHIYQVPWKVNPIITLYNKGMFELEGINTVPVTYSQYYSAAEKIKKDRDNDGYVDRWIGYTTVKVIWYQRLFNFYPFYLAASNGAPLIKDNKAAFNNDFAIGVFSFLQKLYKNNYFSKQRMAAAQDPFIMQRVATLFTGPWQISYLDKFKPEDLEYSFYPIPVPDNHEGPVYTYGDPKNLVIFNTCKDPQTAWDFIKTIIDKEGDLKLLEITGQFPRRKNLVDDPYFSDFLKQDPKMEIFAQQVEYIKGVDNHELIVEVFDIISQEYEACVIYDRKTPEKAIHDAARAVDVLLGNIREN